MMEFIIKSTVCLIAFYGFYIVLLKNNKALVFNRFYLISSLLFAIITPFIHVKTQLSSPLNQDFQGITTSTTDFILQGNVISESTNKIFSISNIIFLTYLIIAFILLIRLSQNLYRISKTIRTSHKIKNPKTCFILVDDKILPYSFFKYIFTNKEDYKNKKIDTELVIHEQTHCNQYHSIDIVFVEIIKIFLWFNPLIWIFRKEIELNHEYLADNKVILMSNIKDYQNILLNLVFRNNTTYLASNLNYSLTKKRLIMMTKNKSKFIALKLALVPFLATLLFYFTSCSNELESIDRISINDSEEWWNPILEKHNIEASGYNNFGDIFEMGSKNSIDNKIVTLENAVFFIRSDKEGYILIDSPLAYHNLESNIISGEYGTIKIYDSFEDDKPNSILSLKNFNYQIRNLQIPYDSWDAKEMTIIATP